MLAPLRRAPGPEPPPVIDPPPSPPADPAPPTTATPRRRRRRRLLVVLGSVLGLLAILVACLPAIASMDWVRRRVEASASSGLGRRLSLEGIDAGWGETRLRGLVLRAGPGEGDRVLLRVEEVVASPRLFACLRGSYEVPRIEVLRPVLRIDLRPAPPGPPGAGPVKPRPEARGGPAGEPAEEVPPFEVHLAVREGTLLVVLEDGTERRMGGFEARVDATRDGACAVEATLDAGKGGKLTLRATVRPFAAGRTLPPGKVEGDLSLLLAAVDLAEVAPLLRALAGVEEARGTVEGSLSGRLAGGLVEDGKVELRAKGIALAGAFGGRARRLDEQELLLEGGFRGDPGDVLEIGGARLRAPGLDLGVDLARARGTGWNGTARAQVDLGAAVRRARDLGIPSRGDLRGSLRADFRATADASGQRWTADLKLEDVQADPGEGEAAFLEPLTTLALDLSERRGGGLTVNAARVESGWLRGTVRGETTAAGDASFVADAALRLDGAAALARPFGLAPPGRVAGTLEVHATLGKKAGEGSASGKATVTGLEVVPPGKGSRPFREPRVEIAFDIALHPAETEIRALTVEAAHARLSARGRVAPDGSGSLDGEARAEIDPLLDAARGAGVAIPAEAAGVATWNGPVRWTPGLASLAAEGTLEGTDLLLRLPAEGGAPAREVREPRVVLRPLKAELRPDRSVVASAGVASAPLEATLEGNVGAGGDLEVRGKGAVALGPALARAAALGLLAKDPGTGGTLRFEGLRVSRVAGALSAAVTDLLAEGAPVDLRASGSFSGAGAVDARASGGGDLGRLLDLLERAGLGAPAPGAAGALSFSLTARAADGDAPVRFEGNAGVEGLRLPEPRGREAWTQRSVRADLAADLDRKGKSVRGRLDLKADDGTLGASGSAALGAAPATLDAKVDLDLDLAGLCRSRPSLVPVAGLVVGRVKGTVEARGPLEVASLGGSGRLSLDRVRTRPFEATGVELEALLQGGVFAARTFRAAVNGGTVAGKATLGLADRDHRHTLEVHAAGVQVDRALGDLLAQVVPLFALEGGGAVSGKLRTDLRLEGEGKDWEAVKPVLRGGGTLAVEDGSVAGGSILGEVLSLLGGGKEMAFSSLATAFTVHDGRVWNERLVVDGKEHAMVLKGSTTLEGKLDYALSARALRMGKKRRERLAPVLDADGNLPFGLGGSLSRPKVKPPDLKKIAGGAVGDALKKRLEDLLGGKDE